MFSSSNLQQTLTHKIVCFMWVPAELRTGSPSLCQMCPFSGPHPQYNECLVCTHLRTNTLWGLEAVCESAGTNLLPCSGSGRSARNQTALPHLPFHLQQKEGTRISVAGLFRCEKSEETRDGTITLSVYHWLKTLQTTSSYWTCIS